MAVEEEQTEQEKRDLSQVMRMQERLMARLQEVRTELDAPATERILRKLRDRCGGTPEEAAGGVTAAVEEAIRSLQLLESEVKRALFADSNGPTTRGLPDLPAPLARFLAERSQLPGFSYELSEDPIRGWVIRWKEHTDDGTIRGYGQLYERPHAWLEDYEYE